MERRARSRAARRPGAGRWQSRRVHCSRRGGTPDRSRGFDPPGDEAPVRARRPLRMTLVRSPEARRRIRARHTRSGMRAAVASRRRDDTAPTRLASSGAASSTCSQLSSTRSVWRSAHAARTRRPRSASATSAAPNTSAIADATNAASRSAASSTNTTRTAPPSATLCATSSASASPRRRGRRVSRCGQPIGNPAVQDIEPVRVNSGVGRRGSVAAHTSIRGYRVAREARTRASRSAGARSRPRGLHRPACGRRRCPRSSARRRTRGRRSSRSSCVKPAASRNVPAAPQEEPECRRASKMPPMRDVRVSYDRCAWSAAPIVFTLKCIAAAAAPDAPGRHPAALVRQLSGA